LNHYQPDGTFSIPTPLIQNDMDLLNEYVQSGGTLMVMGQDFSSLAAGDTPSPSFLHVASN
jgi:hypothetical protein